MSFSWFDPQISEPGLSFGSLALWVPLLDRLQVAEIIEYHLPTDPQAEYQNGRVLSLVLAARLSNPVALVNVPAWAQRCGADALWGIPADKLNDDRLGRALDKFYTKRHDILAHVAAKAAEQFDLPLDRLHYDPTHLLFYGDYDSSQPRNTSECTDPPAHITNGHSVRDHKIVHAGVCAAIDDYGAVPIFGHVTDGNHNGHTAIREQFDLLQQHLQPQHLTLFSDRGTYSNGHWMRLAQHGFHAVCAAPWKEYQALYDEHRSQLIFRRASYLSIEQKRRRATGSELAKEHYEIAVLKQQFTDSQTGKAIPSRVLFVFSTADQKVAQKARLTTIAKIQSGLQQLAEGVLRGHHLLNPTTIARRVTKLFGNKGAARYFHWELVPLSADEQTALPPPARGCRRATHRLEFSIDQAAADADAAYDGMSVLVVTVPRHKASADSLFTGYKEQVLLEHTHHQLKTPLAVRPIFLKNPRRVEALVCLMLLASTVYHLLQRCYRQHLPANAPVKQQRTTTETLLRAFAGYTLCTRRTRIGRFVSPTQLSRQQRQILTQLRFPTPSKILTAKLAIPPPC